MRVLCVRRLLFPLVLWVILLTGQRAYGAGFPPVPVDSTLMDVHWFISASEAPAYVNMPITQTSSNSSSHRFITTPGLPISLVTYTPCKSYGCFGVNGPSCAQGYRISFWNDRSPAPTIGKEVRNYLKWGANFCPPGGGEGWSTWISASGQFPTPDSWLGDDYYLQSIVDVYGNGQWQSIGDTIRFSVVSSWCPAYASLSGTPAADVNVVLLSSNPAHGRMDAYQARVDIRCMDNYGPVDARWTSGSATRMCSQDMTWSNRLQCAPCPVGWISNQATSYFCIKNATFPVVPVDPNLMEVHWFISASEYPAYVNMPISQTSSNSTTHRFITTPGLPLSLVTYTPCKSTGCFGPSGPRCAQGYRISFWNDRSPAPTIGKEVKNYLKWGANFCPPGGGEGWSTWIAAGGQTPTPDDWLGDDYYLQSIVDVYGNGQWQSIGDTIRFSVILNWCLPYENLAGTPDGDVNTVVVSVVPSRGRNDSYETQVQVRCLENYGPVDPLAVSGLSTRSCSQNMTWTNQLQCQPCPDGFVSNEQTSYLCALNTGVTYVCPVGWVSQASAGHPEDCCPSRVLYDPRARMCVTSGECHYGASDSLCPDWQLSCCWTNVGFSCVDGGKCNRYNTQTKQMETIERGPYDVYSSYTPTQAEAISANGFPSGGSSNINTGSSSKSFPVYAIIIVLIGGVLILAIVALIIFRLRSSRIGVQVNAHQSNNNNNRGSEPVFQSPSEIQFGNPSGNSYKPPTYNPSAAYAAPAVDPPAYSPYSQPVMYGAPVAPPVAAPPTYANSEGGVTYPNVAIHLPPPYQIQTSHVTGPL